MTPFSLNIRGKLLEYNSPAVMGILNITDDSFYSASRVLSSRQIGERAVQMVEAGSDIIDIGAMSSRPGAIDISEQVEKERLHLGIESIRAAVGDDVPISVDTFRSSVAEKAVEWGVDIINDISGGTLDPKMFATVASLKVPYILMHMRGTPQTMAQLTDYKDVCSEVILDLGQKLATLEQAGISDVIIDPGFGFAKTLDQNYQMLAQLDRFRLLQRPILVGISRKSMISKLLNISADQSQNGTTALNITALERGASILRVHDVAEAAQAIRIVEKTREHSLNSIKIDDIIQ